MSGGIALLRDIGAYIKAVVGTVPFADTGTVVNGAAIDRLGFDSCILHTSGGAVTGAPTAQTLDSKLQESTLAAGPWTNLVPAIATVQLTADNTEDQVDADLSGVKRFIRVVRTVSLTAGTTPTWPVSSNVILGGAAEVPA